MTTLLVDGDLFAYQTAAGTEKPLEFDGTFILSADAEVGIANLKSMIDGFADTLDADRVIVALSDAVNYRHSVLPTYKSNREGIRRPMILGALKAFLEEEYETFTRPGLEADDVMGILATNPKKVEGRKVIVTEDKDLRTVPGLHWNPKKEGGKNSGPTRIDLAEADERFYAQCLSGDMTDGYGGCPGIGKLRAEAIARNPVVLLATERPITRGPRAGTVQIRYEARPTTDIWEAIVSHYVKAGLTEEDAITTARVARILRHEDYNYKTKEPILWSPVK